MSAPTIWTPEQDATLRQLWAEGHSTAEIGRRMGGMTKNMVIGRAGRIGLPRRDNPMVVRAPTVRNPRHNKPRPVRERAHLPRTIIEAHPRKAYLARAAGRQVRLEDGSVEIVTASGHSVFLDAADAEEQGQWCWTVLRKHNVNYAVRNATVAPYTKRRIYLHRAVLAEPDGVVDHINGNGLDCRRVNLRVVTQRENARNQAGASAASQTGIRGVSPRPNGTFEAYITSDAGRVRLGTFKTLHEAAAARDAAEREHWSPEDRARVAPLVPSAPPAVSGHPIAPSLWRTCQWPTGHKATGRIAFECSDAPQPGRPYCGAHCAVAYVPHVARPKAA